LFLASAQRASTRIAVVKQSTRMSAIPKFSKIAFNAHFIDRTHAQHTSTTETLLAAPHQLIDEDSLPTIYLNIIYQTARL
jgi:hypothetical protein